MEREDSPYHDVGPARRWWGTLDPKRENMQVKIFVRFSVSPSAQVSYQSSLELQTTSWHTADVLSWL